MQHRGAENVERLLQRCTVEDERAARFLALIARLIGFQPIWAPFAGGEPHGLW